jgi:membrane associated rhomboid family serine protease
MRIPRTATVAIAVVTVGVWLLTEVMNASNEAAVLMGVIPARLSGLVDLAPAVPAFLTPLSSTLVHGGFVHIALNMIMLIWCGSLVERVLGSGSLVLMYLIGAYVAALAQWAVDPASMIPMVGASGAISAVMGAFALSFGQQRRIVRSPRMNRLLNSLWLLAAWIVIQLLVGWMAGLQGVLLATPAHVGGFVAGIALQRPLLLLRYRGA